MTGRFEARAGRLWPTAEQMLILRIAIGGDEEARDAFRQWSASVDLRADFSYEIFRLLPLVYDRLHRLGVTDPLMGRLKGAYRLAWYRTQTLLHRATPVVEALNSAGVETLMLKGLPLLLTYYGNRAVRPMADLDIMVRVAQVRTAMAVLDQHGWKRVESASDEDLVYRHAMLFRNATGDEIDLHWHGLYETCDPSADHDFWNTARPLRFGAIETRQLDPTMTLLHLIVHGIRHNPEPPIRWIADTMTVLKVEGNGVDWDRLVSVAITHRLSYRIGLGLGYLVERHGAPVPAATLRRVRAHRPSWLERMENTVVLADIDKLFEHPLTKFWIIFVDYCRRPTRRDPIGFLIGLSHYTRYRLRARGRLEVLTTTIQGTMRRLAWWRA